MAQLDDASSSCVLEDQKQNRSKTSQLSKIHQMIQIHDDNHKISQQINQCMIDDALTLDILSHFDEKSLIETIDSWKIDTFGKKMSIIRGLLVSGIRKTTQNNNNNNTNVQPVLSEKEMKTFEKLTQYENEIMNKIKTFESESKINEQNKDDAFTKYKNKIDNVFDDIISTLMKRKQILLNRLKKIFDKRAQEETDYITSLRSLQKEILKIKQDYNKNLQQYNSVNMNDISKRSQINSDMIGTFFNDNNYDNEHQLEKCDYDYHVTFDSKKITEIKSISYMIGFVGSMIEQEVIINSSKQFTGNVVHKFDILKIIGVFGRVTVKGWDNKTNADGNLLFHCRKLILENGASIKVDGKGYKAGDKKHPQGYSIGNNSLKYKINSNELLNKANIGGGGMSCGGFQDEHGGGGGYGSAGQRGVRGKAQGGNIYGDARKFQLNGNNVHLGSGGGCGGDVLNWYFGGNGGGAIVIECDDAIIIGKGCTISANGDRGHDYRGGCGSGGSIYLHAPIIINDGTVTAIGGSWLWGMGSGGPGGIGRIRVDCNKICHTKLSNNCNFNPKIEYLGSI